MPNFAMTEFSEVALVLACPHNSPVSYRVGDSLFSPSPHTRKDEGDEQNRSCCRCDGLGDAAGMHGGRADGHGGRRADADGDAGRSGGAPGGSEVQQAPGVEVVQTGTSGVLKLDLSADSYSWTFVPIAGQTFTDSGGGSCH
jgi:hypothetical protein